MSHFPSFKQLPHHVAIIMDGNGRWAQSRRLPRTMGYQEGLQAVHRVARLCSDLSINILTLFAFSRENWRRPSQEINFLMHLFLQTLQNEVDGLVRNNVCLKIIGSFESFDTELKEWIKKSQELTANNTGLILVIAVDYGGQWDIIQAVQKIAHRVADGQLFVEDIDSNLLETHLQMSGFPHPDLCIRTGGEYRLSNFLLWQLAYSELYFTNVLWPDFNKEHLNKALLFYSNRERRFGSSSNKF